LKNWILDGRIIENNLDFFIVRDDDLIVQLAEPAGSKGGEVASMKVKESQVPSMMSLQIAEQILRIGKNVNLLKIFSTRNLGEYFHTFFQEF
jgi:hypothetical protein